MGEPLHHARHLPAIHKARVRPPRLSSLFVGLTDYSRVGMQGLCNNPFFLDFRAHGLQGTNTREGEARVERRRVLREAWVESRWTMLDTCQCKCNYLAEM